MISTLDKVWRIVGYCKYVEALEFGGKRLEWLKLRYELG